MLSNKSSPSPSTLHVKLAERFFGALEEQAIDLAGDLVAQNAEIVIPAAGIRGGKTELMAFLAETAVAFPDLTIDVNRSFEVVDGTVAMEVKLEGTQSADWLGIINQEKFLDIRQAWCFGFDGDKIKSLRAFWDQNQVYRRLAVKRIDQVSIVNGGAR